MTAWDRNCYFDQIKATHVIRAQNVFRGMEPWGMRKVRKLPPRPVLPTWGHPQHVHVHKERALRELIGPRILRDHHLHDHHFPRRRQRLPAILEHLDADLIVPAMENPLLMIRLIKAPLHIRFSRY